MSAATGTDGRGATREGSAQGGRRPAARSSAWLIESTLLVLLGILLAVATLNDVGRQVGINHRLIADLETWRSYTGHRYKNVSANHELFGPSSHREVVCGNAEPGPPKQRPQICLVVEGPIRSGRRLVAGGWYLPAKVEDNIYERRYGCFGKAGTGKCPPGAKGP